MRRLVSLLILPGVVLVLLITASGQESTRVEKRIVTIPATEIRPLPGFSFSSTTRSRLKLADGPVEISVGEGVFMSRVEVRNTSSNDVRSLKLDWYLFDGETSTQEVKKGRTKPIKITLRSGESKTIDSKIPDFDNLFKSLAHDGSIGGKWFMEAVVAEIEYTDGRKWVR